VKTHAAPKPQLQWASKLSASPPIMPVLPSRPAVNHSSTVPHYGPGHGGHGRNANPRGEGIVDNSGDDWDRSSRGGWRARDRPDKDKIKLLPSRKSEKAKSNPTVDETKSTPTLDDLSERMAALLRDLNAVRERMATLLRDLSKDAQATTPQPRPGPRCELTSDYPAELEVQSNENHDAGR
jgi:hypothetical protein